jgi:hypothetical protein
MQSVRSKFESSVINGMTRPDRLTKASAKIMIENRLL